MKALIETNNNRKRRPLIRLSRFRRKDAMTKSSVNIERENEDSLNDTIVTMKPRMKESRERKISRLSMTSETEFTPDEVSQIFSKMFSDYHQKLHHREAFKHKRSKEEEEYTNTYIRENVPNENMLQFLCLHTSLLAYLEEDNSFDDDTSSTSCTSSSSSLSSSSISTMRSLMEPTNPVKLLLKRMGCCFMG